MGVGLGDGERRVGHLQPVDQPGLLLGDPVGWTQGPKSHGADGAGWRPVSRVKRRRTSAGVGPAKNRRLRREGGGAETGGDSSGGALRTSTLQAPRRSRWK